MGGCIAEKSAGFSKRISERHIWLDFKKVLLATQKTFGCGGIDLI
jgi:hypothetical protein